MGGIILDTNVLSELMRVQPDPTVVQWFGRQSAVTFYVTAITKSEILLGIAQLPAGKRRDTLANAADKMFQEDFCGNCLSFDESCSGFYASIVANRRRSGFSITTEDAQIAAIALAANMTLLTNNVREFERVKGLKVENWVG